MLAQSIPLKVSSKFFGGGVKKYAKNVSLRHWRILLPKLNICLNQAIVFGKTSFVHKWAFKTRPKGP